MSATLSPTWKPSNKRKIQVLRIINSLIGEGFLPQVPHSKQLDFLCDFGREALYGGAAGGGKSSSLLMAALQFVSEPNYAALILRRTYADLAKPGAIMDRSKSWWLPNKRIHWNERDKQWTFPSGATITFGYLENENDKYNYQSTEFSFIGFDELTQFSESQYTYLFSRLRRTVDSLIPLRVRAGTNPGGRGHAWVKQRFITTTADRKFFPALLHDNPFIDAEEYSQALAELDPVTRRRLKDGDWSEAEGGRFKNEWLRYYRRQHAYYYLGANPHFDQSKIKLIFLTVDTASTVKETAKDDPDWTVISSWALGPFVELIWLGCLRLRVEAPDIPPKVAEMYAKYNAVKVYMEGGGTQKSIPQFCRRQLANGRPMNIIEVQPKGDKLERSTAAQNLAEGGRLYLPSDDPTFPLADVQDEILRFTGNEKNDGHDDIVDTLSMAADVADNKTARPVGNSSIPYVRQYSPK